MNSNYSLGFGRTIAHEIGHLYLNSTAHSTTGLMKEEADLSENKFTPENIATLRDIPWN